MSETFEDGEPFFFATRQPPSAAAIDEDFYLTVTTAQPADPDQVEMIDIILSIDYYARRVIEQLSAAVDIAMRNEANGFSPHSFSSALVSMTRNPGRLSDAEH